MNFTVVPCREVLSGKLLGQEIMFLDSNFYICLQKTSLENCLLQCSHETIIGVFSNDSQYSHQTLSIETVPVVDKGDFWLLPDAPKRAFFKQPLQRHRLWISPTAPILLIPRNPVLMEWQIGRNLLVECDEELSRRMEKMQLGNDSLGENGVGKMGSIRDMLFSLTPTPFFLGRGTLLGWYRHCGLIPFTTDFDTFAPIEVFQKIGLSPLTKAIEHLGMRIEALFGEPKSGLELGIVSGKDKIDVFFIYSNREAMWHFGFKNLQNGKFEILKFPLPKMEVCVGELFGRLFHVPCDTPEALERMYGPHWATPKKFSDEAWWKNHIYKSVGQIANRDFLRPLKF